MISEGRLLSQHGFAKANSWIIMIIAILLVAAGAVQFAYLLALSRSSGVNFHSVLISAILSLVLGIFLITLRHFIKPKQVYQLYENGILVITKPENKSRFIPFENVMDIYLYRSGKYSRKIINTMAFRETTGKEWHHITPNIAHADRLIEVIKNQQLLFSGPQALSTLAQGGVVNFRYLINCESKISHFLRNNFLLMNEKKLRLSARYLISDDGHHIAVGDVQFISGGQNNSEGRNISERQNSQIIKLLDAHGRVLFSIPYTSLFSADLFIALIEHMIHNRIPVSN